MSYKSFYELDNFPSAILKEAVSIWKNLPKEKENNPAIKKYRQCNTHFGHYVIGRGNDQYEDFRNNFKKIISEESPVLEFFVCAPIKYMSKPHRDRGRTVGLNIPIEVDIKNSLSFYQKFEDISNYKHRNEPEGYSWKLEDEKSITKPFWGVYEEEKFDHHNLNVPVIFNPTNLHGGWNKSSKERILLSLSWLNVSFTDAVSKFKKEGWIVK